MTGSRRNRGNRGNKKNEMMKEGNNDGGKGREIMGGTMGRKWMRTLGTMGSGPPPLHFFMREVFIIIHIS